MGTDFLYEEDKHPLKTKGNISTAVVQRMSFR